MASQSIAQKLGLSLTHNRLRVPKISEVVKFYTERFGMKCITESVNQVTQEQVYILGFGGTEGVTMDRIVGFLELLSPKSASGKTKNYGRAGEYGNFKFNIFQYQTIMVYLFIWGFTSLSTLYRSYHDG